MTVELLPVTLETLRSNLPVWVIDGGPADSARRGPRETPEYLALLAYLEWVLTNAIHVDLTLLLDEMLKRGGHVLGITRWAWNTTVYGFHESDGAVDPLFVVVRDDSYGLAQQVWLVPTDNDSPQGVRDRRTAVTEFAAQFGALPWPALQELIGVEYAPPLFILIQAYAHLHFVAHVIPGGQGVFFAPMADPTEPRTWPRIADRVRFLYRGDRPDQDRTGDAVEDARRYVYSMLWRIIRDYYGDGPSLPIFESRRQQEMPFYRPPPRRR